MELKHKRLRGLMTDAIVELCRKEAFYIEELRIEGTVCLVSDRVSVMIAQISEQIGEKFPDSAEGGSESALLILSDPDQFDKKNGNGTEESATEAAEASQNAADEEEFQQLIQNENKSLLPKNSQGKFSCPFCASSYQFRHSLKDHMNKHLGRKPHVCKHCSMAFAHFSSMCAHMKRHHYQHFPHEHTCRLCKERFLNQQSLKQHYTWRHKGFSYQIRQAKTGSKSGKKRRVDDDRVMETEESDTKDSTASEQQDRPAGSETITLLKNEIQHGRDTPTQNGAIVPKLENIKVEESNNPFDSGGQKLISDSTLLGVTRENSEGVQASPLPFMNPPLLWPSIFGQTGFLTPPGFPFSAGAPCQVTWSPQATVESSPTTTISPSQPLPELKRNADGKFQCPYCEKAYSFKHTLKDHINKHTGKRPYVCKHCGCSFIHLASLCSHIKRRHEQEMPQDFQCDICQDKFMNEQSLKQHYTWRHRGEEPPKPKVVRNAANGDGKQTFGTFPLGSWPMIGGQSIASLPHVFPTPMFLSNAVPTESREQNPPTPTASTANSDCSDKIDTITGKQEDSEPPESEENSGVERSASASSEMDLTVASAQVDGTGGGIISPVLPNTKLSKLNSQVTGSSLPSNANVADYFEVIDTGEGVFRYKCKLCGSVFKNRNTQYEHLYSHMGIRPFVCPHCSDSFAHHSSLHNHVQNKHATPQEKEARFRHHCPTCAKRFKFRSELERHFKGSPGHKED